MTQPTIKLNSGHTIPQIGLGVFKSASGQETIEAVTTALRIGYRHIDTARIYNNEESVGEALRLSGIRREDLFVTTKLWNSDQGYQSAKKAFDESLKRLGLDTIDLYLLHWPVPGKRLDSWKALEELVSVGKVQSIGVSNFMVPHLEELLASCTIKPAVNQIELSPFNAGHFEPVINFCHKEGIILEAYSPLTKGTKLNDSRLIKLAEKYGRSPAQMLIRWCIEQGFVVIPKSVKEHRLLENFSVTDFKIESDDLEAIAGWNEGLITGWDPTHAP